MKEVLLYAIESSIALGVFMIVYRVLLNNTSMLLFKRFYLILALFTSAIIPNLSFQMGMQDLVVESAAQTLEHPENSILLSSISATGKTRATIAQSLQNTNWMKWIYCIGFLILLIRTIVAICQIHKMQDGIEKITFKQFKLYILRSQFNPFSFFNNIFIPKDVMDNDIDKIILKHEQEHARQKHSFDILILELILIVQWFNPFVWIARKKIKENHEFLADNAVLSTGVSKANYIQTIVNQSTGLEFNITNNLNISFTKKRLQMMTKNKPSKKIRSSKTILSLGILLGLSIFFGSSKSFYLTEEILDQTNRENRDAVINHNVETDLPIPTTIENAKSNNKDSVYVQVDDYPVYPGGSKALQRFINKSIKYPNTKSQGKVYVMFVVGEDGKVRDAKIGRGVDQLLDKEALRIINSLPAFKPGINDGKPVPVSYTVPINFKNE